MENMTIKELYNCEYIKESEELYPLQKWYNKLIEHISEVTVSDVLRMIRQQEFMDLAIATAIEFIKEDSLAGEIYEGELLAKLYTLNITDLKKYFSELRIILSNASIQIVEHDWLCEEEREDFNELINKFMDKINNRGKATGYQYWRIKRFLM